jgi:hypothetical protein
MPTVDRKHFGKNYDEIILINVQTDILFIGIILQLRIKSFKKINKVHHIISTPRERYNCKVQNKMREYKKNVYAAIISTSSDSDVALCRFLKSRLIETRIPKINSA